MSQKFPGGFITKSPVAPTTSAASGIWTLDQQEQYQQAGTWPSPPPPPYIEDVFSTYLYTGNSSTQTITNGIDLAGKGGLVWTKKRDSATTSDHFLMDTARGTQYALYSNSTTQQLDFNGIGVTAYNTTGYTLGGNTRVNASGLNYVGWTFRKQAKFFDVVTYTGNGGTPQNIAHSLGSVPGFIVVKPTSTTGGWICYHRSLTASGFNPAPYNTINLNSSGSIMEDTGAWNSTAPTSTVFTIGSSPDVNTNGASYVAYLFAHDAGGFGATETDNVISCGSFTTDGSGAASVTLGYEPQWVLIKYNSNDSWRIYDNMRGMSQTNWAELYPNTSDAEVNRTNQTNLFVRPNATGFTTTWSPQAGNTAIYIAIRRGPMKTPTSGTSVFQPTYGTGGTPGYPSSFTVDGLLNFYLTGTTGNPNLSNRLVGTNYIATSSTAAEANGSPYWKWDFQTGTGTSVFTSAFVGALLQRAPNFFDVVCWSGNTSSSNRRITHNLTVAPELIIIKNRTNADYWYTYTATTGTNGLLLLNTTDAVSTGGNPWTTVAPTATDFGYNENAIGNSGNWVGYLFATCAGVSKVGSYTGTGALQTVNCGFTGGARFVLVKRTDSTGDWYVWDSARGITSSNDPYYLLNSTAAQVTGTNYVDTDSTGFKVTATAPAGINASGGTYIYLAIA